MSTRGLMGIRKKGETKAQYNHFDSYISGLGKDIIDTINSIDKDKRLEVLNNTFDNIILLNEDDKISDEVKQYCITNGVTDTSVSNGSLDDMYCLLRKTQGDLDLYINGFKYMLNGNNFINDTLFCEYAYIINLDTNTLDITFGWHDRITKSYDLMNLNYEEIEKEINDIESEEE